jgi:hypothetical protein
MDCKSLRESHQLAPKGTKPFKTSILFACNLKHLKMLDFVEVCILFLLP